MTRMPELTLMKLGDFGEEYVVFHQYLQWMSKESYRKNYYPEDFEIVMKIPLHKALSNDFVGGGNLGLGQGGQKVFRFLKTKRGGGGAFQKW